MQRRRARLPGCQKKPKLIPRRKYDPARPERAHVSGAAEPFAVASMPLGACTERWRFAYLSEVVGDLKISAHVSTVPGLNFVTKNFAYEVMPLRDLLLRASSSGRGIGDRKYYYYRSQHAKRNRPSSLEVLGPLADDFSLPLEVLDGFMTHSTVLRFATVGMRMWLHYDICDNFLCCVRGRKRVLLLPPAQIGNLYITGSSSLIGSRLLEQDAESLEKLWHEFPLAQTAWAQRLEIILEEGDVLFIPALWPHCTEALRGPHHADDPEGEGLAISVNVFLLRPELAELHDSKDIWANRELLPAQEAFKALEERVLPALKRVPAGPDRAHRAFYCRKAAAALLAAADEVEQAEGRRTT